MTQRHSPTDPDIDISPQESDPGLSSFHVLGSLGDAQTSEDALPDERALMARTTLHNLPQRSQAPSPVATLAITSLRALGSIPLMAPTLEAKRLNVCLKHPGLDDAICEGQRNLEKDGYQIPVQAAFTAHARDNVSGRSTIFFMEKPTEESTTGSINQLTLEFDHAKQVVHLHAFSSSGHSFSQKVSAESLVVTLGVFVARLALRVGWVEDVRKKGWMF